MSNNVRPPKNRMYPVTDPQGICLIVNIRRYDPETTLADRMGSEKDVESVCQLFAETLQFNVRVETDLTGDEIRQCFHTLTTDSELALQSHGCLICFLMAHGSNEKVLGRDGVSVSMAELTALLDSSTCPALANKPKVFIVHASREPAPPPPGSEPPTDEGLAFTNFFLCDSDFLVCYANTEGSPVLDDPESGSAFIQAVCRLVRDEYRKYHLDDILTDVNQYLKTHPVQRDGRLHYYVPEKVSSLTRKCFVDPAMAAEPEEEDH